MSEGEETGEHDESDDAAESTSVDEDGGEADSGRDDATDHEERIEDLREERDELANRVEALKDERDELTARLKRTAADFENFKKRKARERERVKAEATEELVGRLLDVRDNLKRAVDQESGDAEALREGVKLTLDEFDRVLDAEGVEEIDPAPGSDVDPERHEVMLTVDSDEPEGQIAEVYQAGYGLNGKVLRPAQVTVSDGSGEAADSEDQ